MDTGDYAEFARKIYEDYSQHERNVLEFCTNVSLVSLADFHEGYKKEIDVINSEITPLRDNNNAIQDFVDIFKAFDEYPGNLQKLRKPAARETQLQRHNSTVATVRTTQSHPTVEEAPVAVQPAVDLTAYPMASETRKDFKKFQAKLQQLLSELSRTEVAAQYKSKLQHLQWFAMQLDKLSPSFGAEAPRAFSDREEDTLNAIVGYTDDLNYILMNMDVFQGNEPHNLRVEHHNSRLEKLMEIVTYTLGCLNS